MYVYVTLEPVVVWVTPLPKSNVMPVVLRLVVDSVTVVGAQPLIGVYVSVPVGLGPTVTVCVEVSWQPLELVAISFTWKVPAVVKVAEGFASDDELPFPKIHWYAAAPVEVFVKFTVNGGQ